MRSLYVWDGSGRNLAGSSVLSCLVVGRIARHPKTTPGVGAQCSSVRTAAVQRVAARGGCKCHFPHDRARRIVARPDVRRAPSTARCARDATQQVNEWTPRSYIWRCSNRGPRKTALFRNFDAASWASYGTDRSGSSQKMRRTLRPTVRIARRPDPSLFSDAGRRKVSKYGFCPKSR